MDVKQIHFRQKFSAQDTAPLRAINPTLLIVFGSTDYFVDGQLGKILRQAFPQATVIGCSTAGEIAGTTGHDNTLVITAVALTNSVLNAEAVAIAEASASRASGTQLGQMLAPRQPQSVFILSPGLNVNGSDLVSGLQNAVGANVTITGGLAGDGGLFKLTYTMLNETIYTHHAVAVAFTHTAVKLGCGSQGGWLPFGPERTVTRAEGNVLYELDGKSALQLYKEYLGDKAKDLPRSGLLYPLLVRANRQDKTEIIRTILDIDEAKGSIILAGSIENLSSARLMHAKTEGLVDGAHRAGVESGATTKPSLAILISCVGRKLVMGDDVDDEIAAVRQALGENCVLTGFYSYGEIAPSKHSPAALLQNQTMTISHLQDAE